MKITAFIFIIGICMGSAAGQQVISVVYSHNSNGLLENCHCPERSYGALEKRAAVIDSIRQAYQNVLLVDTGDILDIRPHPLLHDYIMRAYRQMNYDYWVPGDQDFVEGEKFFLNDMVESVGKLVAANLRYKGERINPSYVIHKYGDLRIAICGIVNENLHKYLETPTSEHFTFEDHEQVLKHIIPAISEKSDYIILLSHSGMEQDRKTAREFPAINLIIGGHSQTLLEQPEMINTTYITQIGESGYRLGLIKLTFKDRRFEQLQNETILLKENMRDDPNILELIRQYHQNRLQSKRG